MAREQSALELEIAAMTAPAVLREKEGDRAAVRCFACGHRCLVLEGLTGICKVRFNRGGELFAPHGYVAALQCDPIEKKPFFHVLPGTEALSFGMLGCDLHCAYCQNWEISQMGRDAAAGRAPERVSAESLVRVAAMRGASAVVSTYNEPLITAEWALDVFRAARNEGLLTAFVSNGNATPEVIAFLRGHLDLYKVDLKSFREESYRRLGGRLGPVLDSMRRLVDAGIWLEVVTLLIPGFNDSSQELRDIARFIAGLGPGVPWHVTAFHPNYRMTDPPATPVESLLRAASIGRDAGLQFVYAGNLPGHVGGFENTACPGCGEIVVERRGFRILAHTVSRTGQCTGCGHRIPGIWSRPGQL
jgi:pyruvate formate lyase activating enzyme